MGFDDLAECPEDDTVFPRPGTWTIRPGYLHRTAMNLFRSQYRRAKVALKRAALSTPGQDVFEAVEKRDAATQALGWLSPRLAAKWYASR